jgi:hypothetical protein
MTRHDYATIIVFLRRQKGYSEESRESSTDGGAYDSASIKEIDRLIETATFELLETEANQAQ